MARKKTEPKPATKPKSPNETPTIPFRLTPDDLAAIDKIASHYHLMRRVDAVRLAVHHVAESMGPITPQPPKKKLE
jgi:hypothetical protein